MPLASLSSTLTSLVSDHGLYAVFVLMLAAAIIPIGSELVMLYGGAVASGAFSAHVVLFGHTLPYGWWSYVAMALTGIAGNTVGAALGWAIGAAGGRAFLDRYGTLLHVGEAKLDRTERWFDHFGATAVPLGFATPLVRSFVAIPAGIARMRLGRFTPLAALGCAVFCFAVAGLGWALGSSYSSFHSNLRYVDVAVVLLVVGLAVAWFVRRRRASRLSRRASDPAG